MIIRNKTVPAHGQNIHVGVWGMGLWGIMRHTAQSQSTHIELLTGKLRKTCFCIGIAAGRLFCFLNSEGFGLSKRYYFGAEAFNVKRVTGWRPAKNKSIPEMHRHQFAKANEASKCQNLRFA